MVCLCLLIGVGWVKTFSPSWIDPVIRVTAGPTNSLGDPSRKITWITLQVWPTGRVPWSGNTTLHSGLLTKKENQLEKYWAFSDLLQKSLVSKSNLQFFSSGSAFPLFFNYWKTMWKWNSLRKKRWNDLGSQTLSESGKLQAAGSNPAFARWGHLNCGVCLLNLLEQGTHYFTPRKMV